MSEEIINEVQTSLSEAFDLYTERVKENFEKTLMKINARLDDALKKNTELEEKIAKLETTVTACHKRIQELKEENRKLKEDIEETAPKKRKVYVKGNTARYESD
jgi:peptidoglycan hydrolase CwlO-like protein